MQKCVGLNQLGKFCRDFFSVYTFILIFSSTSLFAAGPFLANWMGELQPILGNRTLLDLTLPGTHDSLTYDLSTVVSRSGYDQSEFLSDILHIASSAGLTPGGWIRSQSETQFLSITDQLNNGVRYIDFRAMYSDGWYSLHFVQSKRKALAYMQEVYEWMVAHPTEVVVILISKHGSKCATGDKQYPGVSVSEKQIFWNSIRTIFSEMLYNRRESPLSLTPLSTLVQKNQRVIIYAADYDEFTDRSENALDACQIDEWSLPKATLEQGRIERLPQTFIEAKANPNKGGLSLLSIAMAGSGDYFKNAFFAAHFPFTGKNKKACVDSFKIPKMASWYPENLLEFGYLSNYYHQLSLELANRCNLPLPNMLAVDGLGDEGTLVIGSTTNPRWIEEESGLIADSNNQLKYAFVDTLLVTNVQRVCKDQPHPDCEAMISKLRQRKGQFPLQRWDDPARGRLKYWPIEDLVCP
jgi:hypothetical protein